MALTDGNRLRPPADPGARGLLGWVGPYLRREDTGDRTTGRARALIKAVHALIYSDDPGGDAGDPARCPQLAVRGRTRSVPPWPIVKTGPSEMGVHPTSGGTGDDAYSAPRHHSISLMCDDIVATKAELEAKGAVFSSGIRDSGSSSPRTSSCPAPDRSSSTSRSTRRPTTCRPKTQDRLVPSEGGRRRPP